MTRPVTTIAPAVFALAASDEIPLAAVASIEDVNPDGKFTARRETVLGINLETDHRDCLAAETRTLHAALDRWRTDLVIDIGERVPVGEPEPGEPDIHVIVKFEPDASARPSDSLTRFAQGIRSRLNDSAYSYRVSLVGCAPDSLTATRGIRVVELNASNSGEAHVIRALIEAAGATYRAHAAPVIELLPG